MSEVNRKIHVGVAGLGMGRNHISSYLKNPNVELTALCDHDKAWLNYVACEAKPRKTYVRLEDMLSDPDIDAVSLCLPTILHAESTIAALRAGKHVLCEKPMATCLKDAEAMEKAALLSGKRLMISHQQRFGHDVQFIKHHADSGYFGAVYFIRLVWRRPQGMLPSPYTVRPDGSLYNRNWFNEKDNGGGVLRDLGTHMLDLAMYLTGFPAFSKASGSLYRNFYPDGYEDGKYIVDSEDMAVAHIRFKNGLSVQLEVNFASYIEEESVIVEVYGTKGGASRINGIVKLFTSAGNADVATSVKRYATVEKSAQDHFIEALIHNAEVPIPGHEGVEIIRILDAVYASSGEIRRDCK